MSTSTPTGEAGKLTKKQQKALKHRSRADKGKGPAGAGEVPELEAPLDDEQPPAADRKAKGKKSSKPALDEGLPYSPLEDLDASKAGKKKEPAAAAKASKKRKRDDVDGGNKQASTSATPGGDGAAKPKKVKVPKKGEQHKSRYIVFVGNLPYKVETADIVKHFEEPCGETPSVRLLSSKLKEGQSKNPKIAEKTKGCAFVEFQSSAAVQAALHLHQSTFISSKSSAKRKINVELTAGGGGNSDTRKRKLGDLKERLQKQREKHQTEADVQKATKEAENLKVREEWKKHNAENKEPTPKKPKRAPKFVSGSNSVKLG